MKLGTGEVDAERLRELKRMGFSDARLAMAWFNGDKASAEKVHQLRGQHGVQPVYKRVDTCAAEFESYTPYLYSTYEEEDEATPTAAQEGHHSGQRTQPHRAGN